MKIKMKTCASATNFIYNQGVVYEVGKDLTEHMAKSFIEVGFAVAVEEEKEEKPKKVTKKNKVKADEN